MTDRRYRFYGLTLSSNQPLPGLAEAGECCPDVRLTVIAPGTIPFPDLRWVTAPPPLVLWHAETEAGRYIRLHYEGLDASAEFVIDAAGTAVWASFSEGVAIEEAAELFLGPVFACVLARRGLTLLHAGVVRVEGRTIGLVGASGAGKSTTSLALVRRGGVLVSDDIAALEQHAGGPAVRAGEPRMRMRPDPAAALCGSFDSLRPMWVQEDIRPTKRYLDLPRESSAGPLPLDALYLLAPRDRAGAAPAVHPLAGIDALPRLMAERHSSFVLDRAEHRRDFERLGRLVAQLPVRELHRPEGLHATEQTAEVLLADVRALT